MAADMKGEFIRLLLFAAVNMHITINSKLLSEVCSPMIQENAYAAIANRTMA